MSSKKKRCLLETSIQCPIDAIADGNATRFLVLVMQGLLSAYPIEGQEVRVQRLVPTTVQVF